MGIMYLYCSKDLGPIVLGTSEDLDLPYKLGVIQLHLLTTNINCGTIPCEVLHLPYLVCAASSFAELFVSRLDWSPKDTEVAHSSLEILDKNTLSRWKKDKESASFTTWCGKHRGTFKL